MPDFRGQAERLRRLRGLGESLKEAPTAWTAIAEPAGERLDCWVHEHVLGWGWWRCDDSRGRCLFAPGTRPHHFGEPADGTERLVYDWPYLRPPSVSTLLGPAWRVVRHFRDDPGYDWLNGFQLLTCGGPETSAREFLCDFDGGKCPGRAIGETAPLAICRAALAFALWRRGRSGG